MNELDKTSELSITPKQTSFTPAQRKALAHMGVDQATDEDLAVFFHQIKRTGLDPFAKQIYMIGRRSRTPSGQYEMKYTIQTGIDGLRLIGHRAASKAGETVHNDQAEFMDNNGKWHAGWSLQWGLPVAALARVYRNGSPFTGFANFDEYKQTTRNGQLNSMWATKPTAMIAKCAEALAWRMAFPQDLAGVYSEEEMGQASNTMAATDIIDQEQEETEQYQQFLEQAEQQISDAWDNQEQLGKLGSWAKQKGWPTGLIDRIRTRWEELNPETVVDAEVVEEK